MIFNPQMNDKLMRICIASSIKKPLGTHPCTVGEFFASTHDPTVDRICRELKALPDDASTKEKRKELKDQLPIYCFNASKFEGDYRNDKNATPSGFCMIDWDKVGDLKKWISDFGKTPEEMTRQLRLLGLVGFHISPSGNGYHGIIRMRPGETVEDAQKRVAGHMSKPNYDNAPHAVSQGSFAVPYYYWLFFDYEELLVDAAVNDQPIEVEAVEVPVEAPVAIETIESKELTLVTTECAVVAQKADIGAMTTLSPQEGPVIEDAEILSEETTEEQQDAYDSVPMTLIVNGIILDVMKLTAPPEEGTRNNHYLELQRHLRYFCNFDPETMVRLAPDWGLSETERLACCRSAAKYERVPGMPRALKELLQRLKGQLKLAQGMSLKVKKREPMPTNLPKLLTLLMKLMPEPVREAAFFCALPFLGALTTALRYRHNEVMVETTTLNTYLRGHMSAGKGFTRVLRGKILKPIIEDDKRLMERETQWREECNAAGDGKKERDPHNAIRQVEADFSLAALRKQVMNSRGQHLIIYSEESDSIKMTNECSSILRNAFDGSNTGQSRVSTNSVNGNAPAYINLQLSGTPAALNRLMPDPEDGLVSRFLFVDLDDRLGQDEPQYGHLTKSEYNTMDKEVYKLHQIGLIENVQNLPDYQPEHTEVWIKSLPRTEELIKSWNAARKLEFLMSGGKDIALEKFSRRIPTDLRRLSMILWAMEGGKETTRCMNLLQWAADYMLNEILDIYGYRYEDIYHKSTLANTPYQRHSKNSDLLNLLPSPFSIDDVVRVQQARGIVCTRQNAYVIVSRLKGFVEPTGEPNHWKKVSGV